MSLLRIAAGAILVYITREVIWELHNKQCFPNSDKHIIENIEDTLKSFLKRKNAKKMAA